MRKQDPEILNQILQTIESFPQGASFQDIQQILPIPYRSLQRYLANLIKETRLSASGSTRARRFALPIYYSPIQPIITLAAETPYQLDVENLIPLSQMAMSIQTTVRQHIQARRPVGYNFEFLNSYRPNETFYLPESTRNHLFEMGNPIIKERTAGTYAKQILNRLLIDLSWNSSRLEGNTYSLLETERLLELGEIAEGKNRKEAQMILNHKAAIKFMVESADQIGFNNFTILNLHNHLSFNLLHDTRACGNLRTKPVGIAKSVYQPLAVPQLINEYFRQILDTANAILNPFEQAFFAMVHLPYLQPFLDVNKRVSRLAANIPLIRENLCPLSFVDVPEQVYVSGLLGVYELNRIELLREVFVWAYERSASLYSATRQELGEPDPFRFQYQNLIIESIGEVVRGRMDKSTAVTSIKKASHKVIEKDRAKLLEVIETELMSLHIGNIARFWVKPSEYDEWLKTWN